MKKNEKGEKNESEEETTSQHSQPPQDSKSSHTTRRNDESTTILLATAVVNVLSSCGERQKCRIFIDPGSEATFISEGFATKLNLHRKRTNLEITGVGGSKAEPARGILNLQLSSRSNNFKLNVEAIILSKITGLLPRHSFYKINWSHLTDLSLADPQYNQSSEVDILLGMDYINDIMLNGVRRGEDGSPLAQETKFG